MPCQAVEFAEHMVEEEKSPRSAEIVAHLDALIADRVRRQPEGSYTVQLLRGGAPALAAKLREEAGELAEELFAVPPSAQRVVSEGADLFYHLLVALALAGTSWKAVEDELTRRFGTSGLAEKASRGPGGCS